MMQGRKVRREGYTVMFRQVEGEKGRGKVGWPRNRLLSAPPPRTEPGTGPESEMPDIYTPV